MWLPLKFIVLFILLIPTEITQIRTGVDYCRLRGSFYIEEFPADADILVYEEDSEAFADLLIFETDNALFADKPGVWYFVDKK